MSSQEEPSPQTSSSIRLPPISFVSDSTEKPASLQPPSGLGISSILSPQDGEEPPAKKAKFELNGTEPQPAPEPPVASSMDKNGAEQPPQSSNSPHHHHHHHHHHFGQALNEPIAHVHKGNHIHLLSKEQEEVSEPKLDVSKKEDAKKDDAPKKDDGVKDPHTRKAPLQLNKDSINEIIKSIFPERRHLGSLVYNPTTTWLTLQTSQLTGLKDEHFEKFEELRESYREKMKDEYYAKSVQFIPVIPPFPADYINYLLEIKIPYRFIKIFKEQMEAGEIDNVRELWGGVNGVYTDDSDILTVLAHLGFFEDKLDLSDWNPGWTKQDIIIPQVNQDNDIKGDLSVTILLLPPLDEYHGFQANGINSRHWLEYNRHNGLSYAVFNIKWEIEGSYLRDKAFFKRYQTELEYDLKYMKQKLEAQGGWQFSVKHYQELKKKFQQLEEQPSEATKKPESEKVEGSETKQ